VPVYEEDVAGGGDLDPENEKGSCWAPLQGSLATFVWIVLSEKGGAKEKEEPKAGNHKGARHACAGFMPAPSASSSNDGGEAYSWPEKTGVIKGFWRSGLAKNDKSKKYNTNDDINREKKGGRLMQVGNRVREDPSNLASPNTEGKKGGETNQENPGGGTVIL